MPEVTDRALLNAGPSARGWHVITLSRGAVTKVDAIDFKWLSRWKWSLTGDGKYAHRKRAKDEIGHDATILMHRVIMRVSGCVDIDHISGDTLDNRRHNLRVATRQQNVANSRIRKDNKSGIKGVVWDKNRNKWAAYIKVNYKSIGLGRFATIEEAADAYARAATKYFGRYARTSRR